VGATVVDAQGNVRVLDDGAVGMEATRRWCSPHTGAEYPVEWRVAVEGEVWTVDAVLTDQEFVAPGMSYWEGAAVVRGAVGGRAFVELVGAPLHQANVHLLDPGGF
jgi:predicted secreted hydrolase